MIAQNSIQTHSDNDNNGGPLALVKKTVEDSSKARDYFWTTHSQTVVDAAQLMGKTVLAGGKILLFGNGGSAADAQHMAAEMVGRMLVERKKPVPAIALTTDTSALTAIGNDYSYDEIFSIQLRALGRPGDLAIGISTSGNSKNVIQAIEAAKAAGLKTLSFTGKTGGRLKQISDFNLNVELGYNSSMIQETHITIVHLLVDLMDRFYLNSDYV